VVRIESGRDECDNGGDVAIEELIAAGDVISDKKYNFVKKM
jgi:hypothetical protein